MTELQILSMVPSSSIVTNPSAPELPPDTLIEIFALCHPLDIINIRKARQHIPIIWR